MNFQHKKILVLDGNSRQILPILKELYDLGCHITTVNTSRLDNGYTSRYPKQRLVVSANEGFYQFVLQLVKTGKFDVLLPLSDKNMDLVTKHEDELKNFIRLPIPDRETFLRAYDKQKTMSVCMAKQIPCPITRLDDETLEEFLGKTGFPIIAKPRMACGSMGLKIVKSQKELDHLIGSGIIKIEEYVFQEFIPQTGRQINVHLFMDEHSQLCSGVVTEKVRWYPVDGGASCLCRTIKDEKVLADCEHLLQAIQWRSYCEIELIEDPRDGIAKVMEINGRASASIKIMDLARVNVARQLLQLAYGERVTQYKSYPDDIRMRRLLTDILWFLQSPNRFHSVPCWFNPSRTRETTFSLRDPLPFIVSFLRLVPESVHYKNEMKKRQRSKK